MRIQDARQAMPPMPQAVGERVRAEVERQLAREERRARRRAMRVALAAALCVVGFATVACAADMGEMGYWQPVAAIGNGGNYIARLAPGQSQTVRMAWIVDEGDLAHMALDLTGGASCAFSEEARACGLVDLRAE